MNTNFRVMTAVLILLALCTGQEQQQSPPGSDVSGGTQVVAVPIIPGRLIHRVDPDYPKQLRKRKIQGAVTLKAVIEKDGSVDEITVVGGDHELAALSIEAVRRWNFEPYAQNGQPVAVQVDVTITFGPHENTPAYAIQPTAALNAVSALHVGHGVTAPRILYDPAPQYTKQARKAKYEGTCVLSLVVGEDGQPREIQVTRSLGMGLDEKAIEAVRLWRFQPGMKDGKPVAVYAAVEVQFHLY